MKRSPLKDYQFGLPSEYCSVPLKDGPGFTTSQRLWVNITVKYRTGTVVPGMMPIPTILTLITFDPRNSSHS